MHKEAKVSFLMHLVPKIQSRQIGKGVLSETSEGYEVGTEILVVSRVDYVDPQGRS
jgi:hypothetical protein